MFYSLKFSYNIFFLVLLFYLITRFIFIVRDGNVAVITTFGKVTGEPRGAGIHIIIPFVQKYHIFSIKTIVVPEKFSTLTQDLQVIEATATIKYRVIKSRAGDIYKQITYTDKFVYPRIVLPSLQKTLKSVFSKYPLVEIASRWAEISSIIEDEVSDELNKENGYVQVIGLDITGLVIAEDYRNAIEAKQIALQQKLKAEIEVKIAEEEAKKFRILSKQLDNKVLYKLFLDKWNGETAVVPGINDNTRTPVIVDGKKK
ncbi:SPFH domain / Band 7 family [seawater metagenome]|uniref:SPFH domain / Band 7 family n=1 Tax=seawater metagenome TaxID=1561972 RepID=A0A5E8CIC4_9ZZZZ